MRGRRGGKMKIIQFDEAKRAKELEKESGNLIEKDSGALQRLKEAQKELRELRKLLTKDTDSTE